MTNKRITELTALDGDDVADNDVIPIVDVSDTTMAASGTTKKITVAELVTDSALTNKFWPNSTTALTGANLANGDKLAVVDVGSPDVPKYITADELAQGSQFTSRFVGKTDDKWLWIGASDLQTIGSATLGATNQNGASNALVWLLDSATEETIFGHVVFPAHWTTYHLDLYFVNRAASSGNVVVVVYGRALIDGETADGTSNPNYIELTLTAPTTKDEVEVSRIRTSATCPTSGAPLAFRIIRRGDQAGDTLANDMGILGVRFERAS
jgi:hypothetical protein